VHWSTLILVGFFALISYQWSRGFDLVAQVLITVLSPLFLVLSIWLHELGHAYSYFLIYKVWIEGIYLYAMGGLTTARLDSSQSQRKSMMVVVSLAGPLINGLLGGIMLLPYYLLSDSLSPLLGFLLYFHGWWQIALAVYNLIPGVPLGKFY
jgi:Zn-dependent protease